MSLPVGPKLQIVGTTEVGKHCSYWLDRALMSIRSVPTPFSDDGLFYMRLLNTRPLLALLVLVDKCLAHISLLRKMAVALSTIRRFLSAGPSIMDY